MPLHVGRRLSWPDTFTNTFTPTSVGRPAFGRPHIGGAGEGCREAGIVQGGIRWHWHGRSVRRASRSMRACRRGGVAPLGGGCW